MHDDYHRMNITGLTYWHLGFSFVLGLLILIWIYLRGKRKNASLTCEEVLRILQQTKLFPVSPNQKWSLLDIYHGHRVWKSVIETQKSIGLLKENITIFSCYSKVKGSPQAVLSILTNLQTYPAWKTTSHHHKQILSFRKDKPKHRSKSPQPKNSIEQSSIQFDVIGAQDEFIPSKFIRLINQVTMWIKGDVLLKKTSKINRFWNKEENGCCWLLEMNHEQQEWCFFLVQLVDKLFEIDQCLVTVVTCSHPERYGTPASVLPAKILSGLQEYMIYRKIQCTPYVMTLTGNLPVHEEIQTDDPTNPTTSNLALASSKARTLFEDVVSKLKDDKKSESMIFKRFRNLFEEKKEWYEEKKRKISEKPPQPNSKVDKQANKILHDLETSTTQSEVDPDEREESLSFPPTPHNGSRHIKYRTADSSPESVPNDADIPSFANTLRKRLGNIPTKNNHVLERSLSANDVQKHERENTVRETFTNTEMMVTDELEAAYLVSAKETVAELLKLKSRVSNIDIKLSFDQQAKKSGGWIYCGVERDVVILRKIYEEGAPLQSYLGKGIIQCSPKTVFDTLRNPKTRFTYDDTLKKIEVIHKFPSGMKIINWQNEVSQLFKRESRDFCILQHTQMEGNKYVIGLRSVGWPQCRESEDITRATLHSSGWVIEPRIRHNQLHSMVTYVVQMELGQSKINAGYLMEELAAKQPLSIAYLRQYLVPTSSTQRPVKKKRQPAAGLEDSGSSFTNSDNFGNRNLPSVGVPYQKPVNGNESGNGSRRSSISEDNKYTSVMHCFM